MEILNPTIRKAITDLTGCGWKAPQIASVLSLGERTVRRVRSEARRQAQGVTSAGERFREIMEEDD